MRLLIYGGCHASIVKRLIDRLGAPGWHQVDALINFELIAGGVPFPYESLGRYDAVLYSPIENKGAYNTPELAAYCAEARIPAFCFPWLEWHGYCPGASKGVFWGHRQWFYPDLVDLARTFDDFDAFAAHARAAYPRDDVIRERFDASTRMLAAQEERNGCDIRISDFIRERHRDSRLFLISDHPSLAIYRSVIEQFERLLGVCLIPSWPDDLPEPQAEERTPIFPRVREALGLAFSDTCWRAADQPARDIDLDAYLALYFHHDSCELAVARRDTRILGMPGDAPSDDSIEVGLDTQVLIRRVDAPQAVDHFAGDIVAPIGAVPGAVPPIGRHLFRNGDWRCRS